MSSNNMSDPRRQNKILRYKPPTTETNPTLEDPTPDYMNLLGMIFSMCGLMLKLKWCAWIAVYCSFISFANSRSSEDTKQMMSSFMAAGVLDPIPAIFGREAGYTLNWSPANHSTAHINKQPFTFSPTGNLESSMNLPCMLLGCGRKPEYLEKTQTPRRQGQI
ncbi:protein Asterix isoform X1 [Phyllopteryx taeniolatus]|uniref:protein Asterix isoform X1 n=1 Tax=Phyllopteryx taeniolatus TaxID=161469 RepID=UPI002AD288D9|nr:protein Asterix isoform X1 [Phyllopteryx taeniolatus]